MTDMVVGVPAHLERIEREVRFLRRNSTGSFGIQIAKSKVSSRYLSDPKGSCHDACKGAQRDLQTMNTRTSLLNRTETASERIPEVATTVQVQIRKKPLRSSKQPVNIKRHTTGKAQRQEIPASTKKLAVSGRSSIARDSPLDGAASTVNKGSGMDKNSGSSKLANKKAVGKLANLEKIEHELSCFRRNSTGKFGIEMGDSKVLLRHASVPTGSSFEASKDGAECNFKTKSRTRMPTRSKRPANFGRLRTSHGEKIQACTKKLAVSASHRSDLKLKPLKENVCSVSRNNKLSRRRYSDGFITRDSPTLQGSLLDDAITKTNRGSRMDKDAASYELSKKKAAGMRRNSTGSLGIEMDDFKVLSCSPSVPTGSSQEVHKFTESDLKTKARTLQGRKIPASSKIAVEKGTSRLSKKKDAITISHSTRTSVKRVSGEKLNNNSPRMIYQRNKQVSLPRKTGKVNHEDDPNKVSQINNLTSLARTKKVQPSHENFPKKTSQLRESASLKRDKRELGSCRSAPKGTLYIREPKTKRQSIQISSEDRKARVSSLDTHGPIRGKRLSPFLSPSSSSLHSDGSSSRNLSNRKSSLSSTSACDSVNGDATVSSSKKSETTSPNRYIKAGRAAIGSPKNLKFRRGKIIDVQSEKLSPRRLKFRPAKILENNGNGSAYARGRSSRRLISYGKSNGAKDETMKVNLRHQSRGDRKEAPILFNNVIEETATKLVETRRSMVKALVGAFETVISLQDPTSSPPIILR